MCSDYLNWKMSSGVCYKYLWSLTAYESRLTFVLVADSTSSNYCPYELEKYLEQHLAEKKKKTNSWIWFSYEILADYSYSRFNYGTQQKSRLHISTTPLHLSYRQTGFKVKKHANTLLSSFAYAKLDLGRERGEPIKKQRTCPHSEGLRI